MNSLLRTVGRAVVRIRRKLRRAYWSWRAPIGIASRGKRVYVNSRSHFTRWTHLGDNVHFNGMEIRGRGRVDIGDNFHSGSECVIISEIHDYSGTALPYDTTIIERPVSVGRNVWIGSRVMILGGTRIGDGAIIQAGSVVVSDIPELAIAGGHPARPFASRDREHYAALEASQRFV